MALNISNSAGFPWAECSILENRSVFIADTVSLKRRKRNRGKHRYEFELVTVDMDMSTGRSVKAKLSRAVDDALLYVHPRLSYSEGVEPIGGLEVSGSVASGLSQVNLSGVYPWQLKAGDYITFSNDTKVHEVAKDTLLVSGVQTVHLTHRVRNPLTNSMDVTMNGVVFQLISDSVIEVSMEASENQDMQITLNAVEDI